MSVKSDLFLIITGSSKELGKVQKKAKSLWKKYRSLRGHINCIGNISGGINKSFLTITPTGSLGGWNEDEDYQELIGNLKEYLDSQEINYDEVHFQETKISLDNNYHRQVVETSYEGIKDKHEQKNRRKK